MIIFVIVSLLLYFVAPLHYSLEYCLVAQLIFLANASLLLYKDWVNEKLGFNLVFSASLYGMCFLFPLFVYQITPDFSLFQFGYNSQVINRCTALASVAYSTYSLGYVYSLKNRIGSIPYNAAIEFVVRPNIIKIILLLEVFNVLTFIWLGGFNFFQHQYLHDSSYVNPVLPYLYQLVQVFSFLTLLVFFLKGNSKLKRIAFIVLAFITLFILLAGSRTLPSFILIAGAYLYTRKYEVSTLKLVIAAILGIILMISVSFYRVSSSSEVVAEMSNAAETELGVLGMFQDVIVNNYSFYVIYDYVLTHGIMWGKTLLGSILSIIPFAQNIAVSVFNVPPYTLSSPDFVTYLILSGGNLGLGTNIVGDAYLAFGLIGVLVLFFLLGYWVVYFRKSFFQGSIWGTIIYLQLVGGALYMARACMIGNLRGYVWSLFIVWIVISLTKSKKRSYRL